MKKLLPLIVFLLLSYIGFSQANADIRVLNTNFQDKYIQGTTTMYVISVINDGPITATNILVSSQITNGISQKNWTGPNNSSGNSEINYVIPSLPSGETVSFTMKILIPQGFTGDLKCTINATSAVFDPNTSNNEVVDTDTRGNSADVSVTNTNNQVIYTPGSTVTYNVVVKNNGPLTATGVAVTNNIPGGITNYSWTGSNGSSGTNLGLNNTIGTLFIGETRTYTITAQIPASYVGSLINTVNISSVSVDSNPSNNTAIDKDMSFAQSGANIVVTNTDGVTTYRTGTTKTYTLTVKNNGPSAAANVVVTNAIPVGITSFSWTGSNGTFGTDVPLEDTIASLANGATVTYTIVIQIPTTFVGNLTSIANAVSSTVDLFPECPACIDVNTLQSVSGLSITNTNNQITYIPGGTSVYTVTVTNSGPQTASSCTVKNNIPAGITNFSWSGNGATGTTNLNNPVTNLLPGQSIVYTITMQIPLTFTGDLINVATVQPSTSFVDNNPSDNTATDTDTLGAGADIVVTNTNNQQFFTTGATTVYTITVVNNGPLPAANVVINNPIPAGVTVSSWTGSNGTSGTNTAVADAIPLLAVGSSVVYTFTVTVPAVQTTDFVSTTTVTSDTPDPNPCMGCVDTDVPPVGFADLVTTITDNSPNYRAGEPRAYTVKVTNNGPSVATNIVVQGTVSPGIDPATILWSNPLTSGNLNVVIPTLAIGASVTYNVYVPVPANYTQTSTLVASVAVTSDTIDPTPFCATCTDVDVSDSYADLRVFKTDNQDRFLLNDELTYVITVVNDGPSDALNVVVNDLVPTGIVATNMSWSSSTGATGTGALNEVIPVLAANDAIIYKVTVKLLDFFTSITGNLINSVSVSSSTFDYDTNNNSDTDVDIPRVDYVTIDSQTYSAPLSGPQKLIKDILINEPCVQLSNFSASAATSFGYFHRNNSKFPFKEGIIIRSGRAKNTEGKYRTTASYPGDIFDQTSTGTGWDATDPDLQAIMTANGLTSTNRDASFVKFSFVPTVESFSFNFLFASQEYGGFQCSTSFVDAFAFILTNTVTGEIQNLAIVPNTTPPTLISVVKIKKAIYYTGGGANCGDLNPQYFGRFNDDNFGVGPEVGRASSAINLRGQTTSLTATANVIPNTLYSIKLVIGDAGDTSLDSAVFLEAGSFNIGGPRITGTGSLYENGDDFSGSNAFCEGTPRILKAGTAPNPTVTYSWKKDDVLIPGANTYQLEVSEDGTYTVVFNYGTVGGIPCQQSDDIVVEFKAPAYPMDAAEDLYACNDGTPTFNLKANEPIVMTNYNIGDFDTYYYTSLEAAQDPAGIPINPGDLANYTGVEGQQIWMKMVNVFDGGNCDPIESFKLFFTTAPSGNLTYTDDGGEPGFCINSNNNLLPTAPDLTVGGEYTVFPTTGLTLNPATGGIDLTTSIAGTYTVTYTFNAQGCSPFTVSTQVIVNPCVSTSASILENICEGTLDFDLFATDNLIDATYVWRDYNNVVISNEQNPQGVIAPTAPGTYIYSVVATVNGSESAPSTVELKVLATPVATFTSPLTSTICTNGTAVLTFTGAAGSTVVFTDGPNTYSVTLDAAGIGTFTTPTLAVETTFTIIGAVTNTLPNCTYTAVAGSPNNEVVVSVGLPTAQIVKFTNAVICSGTATGLEITGTPGSIVSYTKDGVAQTDVTIPASGNLTIDTGTQTVTATTVFTYALTNVVSTPCSNTITGQSATLTVNALPSVIISSTTASVCEGKPGSLTFTGTPNATVTYNNGTTDLTATLDALGTITVPTSNLTGSTTFSLVKVGVTNNTVLCEQNQTGSVTITTNPDVAIATSPTGGTICPGTSKTFEVTATGTNLTYQWYKNGIANPIAGATNAIFTISSPVASDAGDYFVVVSGDCGLAKTSGIATLVISQSTSITTAPVSNLTLCVGQPISMNVVATGTVLTYQWFKGTTAIAGATNPTFNIGSATTTDAGTYNVVITNSCGVATPSTNVVVTINELPQITTSPSGTTICEGQGINLSVVATGTTLTYQWFRNGNPIAGATAANYADNSVTLAEAGNYTVVVSGVCTTAATPAVTSAVATIVVNPGASFIDQPLAITSVCSGASISLKVATTTGVAVTYQWFKGTTAIAGATNPLFTIASTTVADSGSYTCVVTVPSCGTMTSSIAVVTVSQAPVITSEPVDQTICEGEQAKFTVVATGTALAYQWFKGTTSIAGATAASYTIANATAGDNGNYYCEIRSGSCPVITSQTVILNARPLPFATIAQGTPSTICEGQSTQVLFNGTPGAVVIYTINGGTPETITLDLTGIATILPTGTLTETTIYELVKVTYTGPNACSQDLVGSATVNVNPLPSVTLEDGFICIDPVTSAVTRPFLLNTGLNTGEYTFVWFDQNGVIPFASNSFHEVSAVGQYGVTIRNNVTGCEASAFANVDQSAPPTDFSYTVNGFFADNPTVVITAIPAGQYEYQLDFGPFQESNVFDNIAAGTHKITVRDAQACDVLTKEVFIVDYPRYFTPNGDGINDTWNIIPSINGISFAKIYIFDRFGKLVKEMTTSGSGWDGTYNGQSLPATDYWFTIKYQEAGINKEFKAHFSLKR